MHAGIRLFIRNTFSRVPYLILILIHCPNELKQTIVYFVSNTH